jgi:hypothetical protein
MGRITLRRVGTVALGANGLIFEKEIASTSVLVDFGQTKSAVQPDKN